MIFTSFSTQSKRVLNRCHFERT